MAAGHTLDEVAALARRAAESVASMGVAWASCTMPGAPPPETPRIPPGYMELGLGIHGEPGARTCKLTDTAATVDILVSQIVGSESSVVGGFPRGSRAALLVNNLGATTQMELLVAARHALLSLHGVLLPSTFFLFPKHRLCSVTRAGKPYRFC